MNHQLFYLLFVCIAKAEVKEVSRADRKQLMKQRKDMVKRGEDTYEIDQLLGLE